MMISTRFRSFIRGRLFILCALFALLGFRNDARADEPPASAEAERAQRFSAHIAQATQAYKSGQYDQAIESYQAALKIRANPLLLFNIGQAHRKAGRAQEALRFFEQFLVEDPKSKLAPEVRDYVDALRGSQKSAEAPKTAAQPETRADNFLGTKEQRAAEFRRQVDRASAHLNAGEYDAAASAYWAAHSLRPQPIIVFNVAQVYRKAQKWPEAMALYERYLREEPKSPRTELVQGYIAEVKERIREQQSRSEQEAAERLSKANESLSERLAEVQLIDQELRFTQQRTLERKAKPLYKRPWIWVLTGAAAVGVIVGVSVGVSLALRLPEADLGRRMLNF